MPLNKTTISTARCPDCDDIVRMKAKPRIGLKVTCPICDAELEVVGIDPLELEWAVDDDWDDDDWDDDD